MMHQNSIDAWHSEDVQSKAKTLRQRVLEALAVRPMTGSELNTHLRSHSAHKRLSELRAAGLIVERRNRVCTITGQKVAEWGPVVETETGQIELFGGLR